MGDVERPDTVNILSTLEIGATAVYMFSGTANCAPSERIEIYGTNGTLVYHTLGYGYVGQFSDVYYGKCSTGANISCGTYPGESIDNVNRQLVCACAVAPQ